MDNNKRSELSSLSSNFGWNVGQRRWKVANKKYWIWGETTFVEEWLLIPRCLGQKSVNWHKLLTPNLKRNTKSLHHVQTNGQYFCASGTRECIHTKIDWRIQNGVFQLHWVYRLMCAHDLNLDWTKRLTLIPTMTKSKHDATLCMV